ncbi:Interleukin enhancer-binding factor 3 [Saguinus oedipus]|uniref:Interleukin enhancer-binding factor 3 n=1 Tax=Saguinus oedipus TaxID=9490 RepID=A0ABQ9U148_SAGOE|nr:Interleukin enhancer-binding factor 3 [Saguinus oedipus]
MAKHSSVYPTQEELEAVQNMVSHTERERSKLWDLDLELVLLCKEKPTTALLDKVADNLAIQVAAVTEDKEEMEKVLAGETLSVNDPPDVLDRQKCLAALASLRHAEWFQARADGLESCVIVIRVLRDLCTRTDGCWRGLAESTGVLASGIVMPDGSGIYDPCEKEATDAIGHLDRQQGEDITQSVQHALRLAAFGQLHKVLGMDPLPSKMCKKPKDENPVDYTVQIPPSTTCAITPMKRPAEEDGEEKSPSKKKKKIQKKEEKAEAPQAMNALMRLNQLKPGVQYKLVSQTGPVHAPIFTMSVEVDGNSFEASGPSRKTAKLHVAVKVLQNMGLPTGAEGRDSSKGEDSAEEN